MRDTSATPGTDDQAAMLARARPVPETGNRPMTIEHALAAARVGLCRLDPAEAAEAARCGARLVDTRPECQRRADGEIPGAIVIERNHLEWRLDPTSAGRIPEATDHDITWIVLCHEGYSSSLAAASLQRLGLRNATDVIGGFHAWKAAGLPITPPTRQRPGQK
jgi:rhodanese-related sulfurtransferase